MKVVVACNESKSAINFRGDYLRHLKNLGHEVILYLPHDDHFERARSFATHTRAFPKFRGSKNPVTNFRIVLALIKYFGEDQPDVVFAYTAQLSLLALMARAWSKVRLVCFVTGLGYSLEEKSFIGRVNRRLFAWFTRKVPSEFVVLNADDQVLLSKLVHGQKVYLVEGEGIDPGRYGTLFIEAPGTAFRIIFLGRMLHAKGLRTLVAALQILQDGGTAFACSLVGPLDLDNPDHLTRDEIHSWEKVGLVSYLGEQRNIPELLSRFDLLVLPSSHEGFPRVLLEAAAAGLPFVATDIPGNRMIAAQSPAVCLVPVGDSVALAKRIADMSRLSRSERHEHGKVLQAAVRDRFSNNVIFKQLDQILLGQVE